MVAGRYPWVLRTSSCRQRHTEGGRRGQDSSPAMTLTVPRFWPSRFPVLSICKMGSWLGLGCGDLNFTEAPSLRRLLFPRYLQPRSGCLWKKLHSRLPAWWFGTNKLGMHCRRFGHPIASPGPLGGAVSRARAWFSGSDSTLGQNTYPVTPQQGSGGIQACDVFGTEYHTGKSPMDTAIWLVGT